MIKSKLPDCDCITLQVVTNPQYQSSVSSLSSLILDQPQHPLERATWWLEYLLRHPHNTNLTPTYHRLYWFQYFLLDVLAAVLLSSSLLIFIVCKLSMYCCGKEGQKRKND